MAATNFVQDFGLQDTFQVFVDPLPHEEFEKAYAPWPVRIFCLDGDQLSHIGQPHKGEVQPEEVHMWLIERGLLLG